MYLRFSTLAELAAVCANVPVAHIATRLRISQSAWYAYRSDSRFPKSSEASILRGAIQDLLAEALDASNLAPDLNLSLYVANTFHVQNFVRELVHKQFFSLSHLAARAAFKVFENLPKSVAEQDNVALARSALSALMSQKSDNSGPLVLWLFRHFRPEVHRVHSSPPPFPPAKISLSLEFSNVDFPELFVAELGAFATLADADSAVFFEVSMPFAVDIVLCAADSLSFALEFSPPPAAVRKPAGRTAIACAGVVIAGEAINVRDHSVTLQVVPPVRRR